METALNTPFSPSVLAPTGRRTLWYVVTGTLWVAAFLAIVHALIRVDQRPATGGPVIAQLTQAAGTVKLRSESSILWEDAASDLGLHEGDVVATGADGHVALDFPGGRRIILGPNSMMGIEAEKGTDLSTGHLQLVLLKGQVAASMTQPKKPVKAEGAFSKVMETLAVTAPAEPKLLLEPTSIKSGGQVFELETRVESTLALSKAPNAAPKVIPAAKVPPPPPPPKVETKVASLSASPTAGPAAGSPTAVEPAAPLAVKPPQVVLPVLSKPIVLAPIEPVQPVAAPEPAVLKIPKVVIKKVVIPEKVLAPPPKIDPHTLDPLIVRAQSSVLITGVSLQTACTSAKDLLIPIAPKFKLAPSTIWSPFIEFRPTGISPFRIFGANQSSQQFVKLPMLQVCSGPAATRASGSIMVQMIPGHLASGDVEESMASESPTKLTLASLADLPEKPVTVHMQKLTLGSAQTTNWLAFSSPKNTPYRLRLKGKAQLSAIWRLLSGEGRVSLSNQSVNGAPTVVHFQEGRTWLASLAMPSVDKEDVRLIQKLLLADMAFTGSLDGYVRLPLAIKARLNLIEDNLRKDGEIYLLVRDRVVKVTVQDLDKDMASLATVGQSATAFFRKGTQPVLP